MSKRFNINERKDHSFYNNYMRNKKATTQQEADQIAEDAAEEINKKNAPKMLAVDKLKDVKIRIPLAIKIKLLFIGLIFFAFIFLIVLVAVILGDEQNRGIAGQELAGLSGYEYYAGACKQVQYGSYLMGIDEYVARVIKREVPGFPENALKTIAVAARTFVIANGEQVGSDEEDCYYQADNVQQVYFDGDISAVEDIYINASEATKGLILVHNGTLAGHYDASCVYTASEAEAEDSSGNYSDDYYYIKYGSLDIGGTNFQEIDKTKIAELNDKVHSNSLQTFIDKSAREGACAGNHGYGMSQNGAAYLEVIEGYDWKQIINYYFNDDVKIMSIYKGLSYSGNYPIDPNDQLYQGLQFFIDGTSFADFLSSKGTDITSFNEYLKSSIEAAGVGTREGTVTAAMTLIGSLAEMGIKFNYQWGGKYYNLGARSDWGVPADPDWMESICSSYVKLYGNHDHCVNDYKWNAFDCSGFVNWALRNGMQNASLETIRTGTGGETLQAQYPICKPGGVLISSGHIVLVVATDDASKRYIIAESTGSNFNTGWGGLKLSYYSYNQSGYICNNLDDLYGD